MKIVVALALAGALVGSPGSAHATTLSKAQASAILTAASEHTGGPTKQCYPLKVWSVNVKGQFAWVSAGCHGGEEAGMNAILRTARGSWKVACILGDDVTFVEKAMRVCSLTRAEAHFLGFRDK
jgi:hypothetical protein